MYCPSCGKTNSAEQKFCRSCGLGLEKIAQTVVEQLPVTNKNLEERQRKVDRWLSIILGSSLSIFVGAIIYAIVYKIMIVKGQVAGGLIFLAIIVGLLLSLLLVVYRESLREASTKQKLSQPALPDTAPTGKLLPEPNLEPVPSVTERTTELLAAEKIERRENRL